MKKSIVTIALLLVVLVADFADARLRGRRRSSASATGAHGEYVETVYSTEKRYTFNDEKLSLQDIAQMRADAMAKHQNMTHGIHQIANVPAAPVPEGIGYSTASDYRRVSTCICGSTVVADAWARCAGGRIYRVRFWR